MASGVFTNAYWEWIDENLAAGTYTYEVQACQFVGGTLNVVQGNGTTDAVTSGGSIFIAEVYTPGTFYGVTAPPKLTSGAWSSGPPASPQDGDIWMATAVDANGTVWQFRYNAGSASAYKWEFIGGPPVVLSATAALQSSASSTYQELDTSLRFTASRAGDYIGSGNVTARSSGTPALFQLVLYNVSATSAYANSEADQNSAAANYYSHLSIAQAKMAAVTAGQVLNIAFWTNDSTPANSFWTQRSFAVHPIRVS